MVVWRRTLVNDVATTDATGVFEPAGPAGPESVITPPLIVVTTVTPAALVVVRIMPGASDIEDLGILIGPGARGREAVADGAAVLVTCTVAVETGLCVFVSGPTGVSVWGDGIACTVLLSLGWTGFGGTVVGLIDAVTVLSITVTVVTGTVEFPGSARLASANILVASDGSSRCTASTAVRSSLKTPCLNFFGVKSCRAAWSAGGSTWSSSCWKASRSERASLPASSSSFGSEMTYDEMRERRRQVRRRDRIDGMAKS